MKQKETDRSTPTKIYRLSDLVDVTGLSRTTLWRLEREGSFPRHIKLSSRAIGWTRADVEAWFASRAGAVQ